MFSKHPIKNIVNAILSEGAKPALTIKKPRLIPIIPNEALKMTS